MASSGPSATRFSLAGSGFIMSLDDALRLFDSPPDGVYMSLRETAGKKIAAAVDGYRRAESAGDKARAARQFASALRDDVIFNVDYGEFHCSLPIAALDVREFELSESIESRITGTARTPGKLALGSGFLVIVFFAERLVRSRTLEDPVSPDTLSVDLKGMSYSGKFDSVLATMIFAAKRAGAGPPFAFSVRSAL